MKFLGMDYMTYARMYAVGGRGFLLFLTATVCLLAGSATLHAEDKQPKSVDDLWDAKRHIGIDEIEPGMEAYCLTDYGQDGIERFDLKVLSVIRDFDPGRDAILVIGLDERFKHTGPVGGCSGSPVFINGRLAGALAFGWTFSKDPLYGVTPIKEMLEVGLSHGSDGAARPSSSAAFSFDLSRPIDLAEIDSQITSRNLLGTGSASGATALPCPLLISGLPTEASQKAAAPLEAMGFMAVPGLSGSLEDQDVSLTQGGTLTVPLVTGDIKMEVLGTVTEIQGDRVYGFGHSFLGFGPTNLPLASGKVYTVVSSLMRSFKLGTCSDVIGAITADESGAVFGQVGAEADMIPLKIHVERFNALAPRTYNCEVAYNRALTASLIRSAIAGAAFQVGPFPPDHTIEYDAKIDLDDGQSIEFENVSTGMDLIEPASEIAGTLALLMNAPFESADVKDIEFNLRVSPKNRRSYLWSVDVADPQVRAGEQVHADVVIESYLKEKKKFQVSIDVPENLEPGKYNFMLLGVYEYESFLRKSVPYRFVATNYQTMVDALNAALNVDRTKLYAVLVLPPDGIMLEKAELPKLPGTKALILQSDKRAMPVQPHAQWVEKTVDVGTVVADKVSVPITVEK